MATYNTYTAEQERFLRINAPLMPRAELTDAFNSAFGTNKSVLAIKSWCNLRGLHSSNDGKFKDGHKSWQTGLSGEEYKKHYTDASWENCRTAMIDANKTAKIGDEHIKSGTLYVTTSVDYAVSYSERREPKRRVVWREAHGEIPKDHRIIHLDGNPLNCDLSNLFCLPAKYVPIIAKNKWWFNDAELMKTVIKWCELFYATREVATR